MKTEIRTEIEINASKEIVWEKLMDFQNYKMWNPFISAICGSSEINSIIKVPIQNNEQNQMSFKATVLRNITYQEFAWLGSFIMKGLFDGEHQFVLEEIEQNKTRLIHSEKFKGILVRPFLKVIHSKTKPNFDRMNIALKRVIEN